VRSCLRCQVAKTEIRDRDIGVRACQIQVVAEAPSTYEMVLRDHSAELVTTSAPNVITLKAYDQLHCLGSEACHRVHCRYVMRVS
jgi:hypothetical protein